MKYLILLLFTGCAFFHSRFGDYRPHAVPKYIKLEIVKSVKGQVNTIKPSETELRKLFDHYGVDFSLPKSAEHTIRIEHKVLKSNETWKKISYFTATLVPYWEKAVHTAVLTKKGSNIKKEVKLESAFVMHFFLFPVQIYQKLSGHHGMSAIRSELIKSVLSKM